ncbi:MAG: hypothetical protein ACK5PS_06920 [Desulfopila sp.]
MRCPKCGFISFDHLTTCLKCNKNIESVAKDLNGSAYNVVPPSFLQFNTEPEVEEGEVDEVFSADDEPLADDELQDPDLEVLVTAETDEDDEDTDEDDADFVLEAPGEDDDSAVTEEEEQEIEFHFEDLSEDATSSQDDEEMVEDRETKPAERQANGLSVPDELNDMSDLTSPERLAGGEDDDSIAMDELKFDFDFDSDEEETVATVGADTGEEVGLADLELQGLDFNFDDLMAASSPVEKKTDVDDDMDFELDLGDLKLEDN